MAATDQRVRRLERATKELTERLDDLVPRLEGAEDISSQHGTRHTDLGEDPIKATNVEAHTHATAAFPVVEGTNTSSDAAGATHTVSLPANIVEDDILIIGFTLDDNAAVTWPTGWTEAVSVINGGRQLAVGYIEADGTEGATVDLTAGAAASTHTSYRISGGRVNTTATPVEASSGATADSTTPDPDNLNVSAGEKNYLWLAFTGTAGAGSISTAPANYSNLLTVDTASSNIGSAERRIAASSQDPATFTATSSVAWMATTIVVFPTEAALATPPPITGPRTGWDAILSPTNNSDAVTIQNAINNGARRILLLDGDWDVSDSSVTFVSGNEIFGQSRAGTILSWGTANFNAFVLASGSITGNFTVNTAPTDGVGPPIATVAQSTVENIDFGASSGNGINAKGGLIADCFFQGVPDAATGQIQIGNLDQLIIRNCEFGGAAAAGVAIFNVHPDSGPETLPPPNILISGCSGTTECAQGWLADLTTARGSTLTVVGNSIEQLGAALAIDLRKSTAVISSNQFQVKAGETSAAAMINISDVAQAMILNNRFVPKTTRVDVIDIATANNVISGNIIDAESTNDIHLAGTGDNNIVTNNSCVSGDIRIDSSSTGNAIALNIVQTIIGSATANQIGLNVTLA